MRIVDDRLELQKKIQELEGRYATLCTSNEILASENETLRAQNDALEVNLIAKEAREKKYTTIIENSASALFLSMPDGTILEANPAACDMFGYSETEFRALKHRDIIHDKRLDSCLEQRKQHGKVRCELTAIKKNGELFHVDISSVVFCELNSGEERTSSVMIDITERVRIAESLSESEKYYKHLFNLNPLPMWIYDYESTAFLNVNEAAIRHYGYTREEFLQMSILDIRPVADRERIQRHGDQVTEEYHRHHGYWRHKMKDNRVIDVEITAQLIEYNGRKATLVLANDISEKIRVETKLIRSNRRLQAAQQIAKLGYWQVTLDTNEMYWSDQVYTIFGIKKSGVAPDFDTFFQLVHPQDKTYLLDRQRDVLKGNRETSAEHRIILKDGTVKTIAERATLVRDNDGNPLILEGTVQDITERKLAEERLQESTKWSDLLFNSTTDLMFLVAVEPDDVYRCIKVNPAYTELTGLKPEQVIGKTPIEVWPERPARFALEQYRKAIDLRSTITYEEDIEHPAGNIIIETKLTPVHNDNGGRILLLGVARDITERKRKDQIIRENDRRMKNAQFVGNVGDWEFDCATGELSWSDEMFRLFACDPGNVAPSLSDYVLMYPADESARLYDCINHAITKGDNYELDLYLELPSKPTAYHYSVGQSFRDEFGNVIKLYGIVQDITDRKLAEIKLKEERNQLRTLIDNLPDSIYIKDVHGRKMITNEIDMHLMGSPDQSAVIGKTDLEIFGKEAGEIRYQDDMDVIRTGIAIYNREESFIGTNGELIWILTSKVPMRNDYGEVTGLLGIGRIITDRKKEEEARKLARFTIDNAALSIFWIRADASFIDVNESACSHLGYTYDEMIKLRVPDIDVVYSDETWPAHWKELREARVLTFLSKQKRKDGIEVDVEINAHYLTFGDMELNCAFVTDITERRKAEEALQASNERYLYATKATFDAIWDWDIINDNLFWGEGYEKIFGYPSSDPDGNHIGSFKNIHADDYGRVFDSINQALSGTELNWMSEYRYRKANGLYAFVQDKGIIIRNENGSAIRMIGAMQDVTERKLAEEAITKTQEKFTSLVNTIDGIVWEADAKTFAFTYVSQHAEKLLGYPISRWISEPGFWAAHIHPDDRKWAVDYCVDCTNLRKEHQFEYRMIAADGEVIWLADFVTVVEDIDQAIQLRGVMVDITERKKAEEALVKERKLLRILIDNLPDYIYVKDSNCRHIINNKANVRLLGYSSEVDTIGKTIVELLGTDKAAEFIKDDIQVLGSGIPIVNREEPIDDQYGASRWLLTTKIPFMDDNHQVIGLVGISRDITMQKEKDEELQEKNSQLKSLSKHLQSIREEERKILAREVHDELGQLVSAVKMDIDWLDIRLTDVAEGPKKRLQHASATAELLISTIRKIASNLRPSMLDDFGLNVALAWQCREFSNVNGIPCEFEQRFDDTGLSLEVKTELFRICQESLTNAMRHAGATRVTVNLNETDEGLHLCIKDNGRGFDSSLRTGTLGLIGMRERALSVNGNLTLTSSADKGTTIIVTIPKSKI